MANIAVLLEPFPLRNSFGTHAWVGDRLGRMAVEGGQGFAVSDMRVICNEPTMTYLVGVVPAARPLLIQPSAASQAGFKALIADWHSKGISTWAAIQAGSAAHEALYEALLRSVQEVYAFDVLAYWGTNETVRTVAARLGVQMLWAEYGPLRAPFQKHLCLDPQGVNGQASSRHAAALEPDVTAPILPGIALEVLVSDVSAYEAALCLPTADRRDGHATLLRFVKGSSRVVLMVMQLSDDANILAFGNGWTCKTMVKAVMEAHSAPGTVFILRPHPGEAQSYHNYAAGAEVQALVRNRSDVLVFDAQGPEAYVACLSVATEVVCINSSVGFEASLLGKPIRVLGDASYVPPQTAGHDIHAPAIRLREASLRTLLDCHYVHEDRFWTLAFWRKAARDVCPSLPPASSAPLLPTVAICGLGKLQDAKNGLLFMDEIGILKIASAEGQGVTDQVIVEPGHPVDYLRVQGWGADPRTGGMFAGFIVSAGQQSVWSSEARHRPDVASHFADPAKLATGFNIGIAFADLPMWDRVPIRVFGITVSGGCHQLRPEWLYAPDQNCFKPVPADAVG